MSRATRATSKPVALCANDPLAWNTVVVRDGVALGIVPGWRDPQPPRMMLQRADLAAAMGFTQEARVWYSTVLDLWVMPDAELRPTIARARAAMTTLPE